MWIQIWTLHNFHVKPTLFPCVSMHTTWLPCGYYVVSMCTPCGFKVDTIWFPGGHNVVSRWTTQGFKSGYYMVSTGHHRVSTWMPCGVHMDTMCCWGNHMETSTKNSTAWSQLASLFFVYVWVHSWSNNCERYGYGEKKANSAGFAPRIIVKNCHLLIKFGAVSLIKGYVTPENLYWRSWDPTETK